MPISTFCTGETGRIRTRSLRKTQLHSSTSAMPSPASTITKASYSLAAMIAVQQSGLYIGKLLVQGVANSAGASVIAGFTAASASRASSIRSATAGQPPCPCLLRVISVFYVLCLTGNAFCGYFEGVGCASVPTIGSVSHIFLRLAISIFTIRLLGLPAVAFACGAGWLFVNLFWGLMKIRVQKKSALAYQR